jgi:acyl carrier protein
VSSPSRNEVKQFLVSHLLETFSAEGRALDADGIDDETDLLLDGYIDSLGLLELTEALNGYVGFEIDFDALDPEEMTIVGPLCAFVVAATEGAQPGEHVHDR